jgi:hypothetical protein
MCKILIIINLLLIVASLFSGVVFLVKDDGQTNRIVKSLTIRIALSACLICLLLLCYFSGNLVPNTPPFQ